MSDSKLMTPLFYNGNFNRNGRRMRAVHEKTVSNGTDTYRLWRSAGKLVSATIKDGRCGHVQYLRSKKGRCSEVVFTYMDKLIQAVAEIKEEAT